jgi:hypothetical protein
MPQCSFWFLRSAKRCGVCSLNRRVRSDSGTLRVAATVETGGGGCSGGGVNAGGGALV